VQSVTSERRDFYELVLNYYRARHQLLGAEHDVELLKQEVKKSLESCWLTVEEKQTVQVLLLFQVNSSRFLLLQGFWCKQNIRFKRMILFTPV
jgi:hypothetical protein